MSSKTSPFSVLRKKWSIPILEALYDFPKSGFNSILNRLKPIAPKVLADELRSLEKELFIAKEIVSSYPLRISYHLTSKGHKVHALLQEIKKLSIMDTPPGQKKNGLKYISSLLSSHIE